jgi:nitrate reductase molybdenum cofactor assembly chaperone NarJ/NarW
MTNAYETLADLLDYPAENWRELLGLGAGIVITGDPDLVASLVQFQANVKELSLSALQELYTRTFDLNPVCSLEIGYHLFGENYKRGEFLANLRETEAPFDLGQQRQLPDYLPVLLRLLTRLERGELRDSLIADCMIPGIDKMIEALAQASNPYAELVKAVCSALNREAFEIGVVGRSPASAELYQISSRAVSKRRTEAAPVVAS